MNDICIYLVWNCETQPPASIGWVALSSLIVVRLVGYPASVTPPLSSTIWCLRPYKPYIFCVDMILATLYQRSCAQSSYSWMSIFSTPFCRKTLKDGTFQKTMKTCIEEKKTFSWHPRRPRAHPRSIRVSHKIPSHSCFPNILSEISEKNWNKHV